MTGSHEVRGSNPLRSIGLQTDTNLGATPGQPTAAGSNWAGMEQETHNLTVTMMVTRIATKAGCKMNYEEDFVFLFYRP